MDSQEAVVYIVDDDPVYLESLLLLVRSLGFDARGYADAAHFLHARDHASLGCVIVDLKMPDRDGHTVLDQLAKDPLAPPVILITAFGAVPDAVKAMRNGAVAFLQKQMLGETALLDCIHQAFARHAASLTKHARNEDIRQRLAAISEPELQVLELLVRGRDHAEISNTLGVSRRTVENRRSKLMRKLNVVTFPDLVRLAVHAGIVEAGVPIKSRPE